MTQPPHDEPTASSPEELRDQVEQTRHELGETVEALAAKTDVKARAQEKAAEVKEQAATKAAEVKVQAAVKAAEVKEQAAVKAAEVKEQAAAKAVRLKDKAGGLAHQAQDRLPDPVLETTAQGARWARATTAPCCSRAARWPCCCWSGAERGSRRKPEGAVTRGCRPFRLRAHFRLTGGQVPVSSPMELISALDRTSSA
ncbi:DUF3618 domain-containing protein [Streptomyces nogalater]